MAYQVGGAYVPVKPDMRGFHKSIAAEFKALSPEAEKWGHDAGKRFAQGFQDELRGKFAQLPHARIKTDADTKEADKEIDRAARNRTAHVRVKTSGLGDVSKPLAAGVLGGVAYGPALLGVGAGLAGVAADFGAAGIAGAAFGAIAVPMFTKVTAAQKKFTTARQAYDLATTKAQRAAALKQEQAALYGLTPAEKGLARQLGVVKTAWADLNKAQQPVVAKSLQPWFAVAQHGFSFLPSLIRPAADAVDNLGTDAKRALAAPFWGKFFDTLGNTGGIALNGFGHAAGYAADGLAHLFKTFAPDLDQLPGKIDGWAQSFDRWAKSYNKSGFESFMRKTFSPANVANLKSSLKAAGTLLGNVAKASANISPSAMLGLNKVLIALSHLTPTQIEALGILYTASKLKSGSTGGLLGLLGSGKGKSGTAGEAAASGGKLSGALKFAGFVTRAGLVYELVAKPLLQAVPKPGGTQTAKDQANQSGFTKSINNSLGTANVGAWIDKYFSHPIRAFFETTLPREVTQGAKDVGRDMSSAGKSIGHGFASGWDSSQRFVRTEFGKARHWVSSQFAGARGWVASAGTSVARGFGGAYDASSGWVRSRISRVKGWVTGAVSGAGSWLVSAGSAVISGFLSGLKSAWNAVSGWVSSRASWIAAHKGPMSKDRQLLRPHGRAIMGGLLDGMRDGFGPVQAFTRAAGPALPAPGVVAPAIRLPGGVTGSDGAVQVHVLLDGQAIEPRMYRVVSEHDRQHNQRVKTGSGRR